MAIQADWLLCIATELTLHLWRLCEHLGCFGLTLALDAWSPLWHEQQLKCKEINGYVSIPLLVLFPLQVRPALCAASRENHPLGPPPERDLREDALRTAAFGLHPGEAALHWALSAWPASGHHCVPVADTQITWPFCLWSVCMRRRHKLWSVLQNYIRM